MAQHTPPYSNSRSAVPTQPTIPWSWSSLQTLYAANRAENRPIFGSVSQRRPQRRRARWPPPVVSRNDPSWTWSVACRAVSSSSRCDSKKLPFWGRRACFGVPVWSLGGPQLFTNVDGCFSAYLDPFSRDYPVVTPVTPCI